MTTSYRRDNLLCIPDNMNSVRTDLHSYHEEHKYEFDGAQFILNNMLLDFKNKLFMI
jgi:hypothetical protein